LLAGHLDMRYVEEFGRLLGTIHRRGWEERARAQPAFADRSFFESLRIEPYYAYSAAQTPGAARFLADLISETRERRDTLVHGDYSPKNILVRGGRLVLLDHEVIHFGDPAFDLGFSLTHLLSKAHHIRPLRPDFAAAATCYWSAYRDACGTTDWSSDLEPRVVRHTLACLLARVQGRSPLEYLDAEERTRQHDVVLDLMADPPETVSALAGAFIQRL
jgi:aminoglycoside phosphotransferase (APT) family kinase protein